MNVEEEVICLKAVKELIDEMVNSEIIEIFHEDPDFSIRFKSMTHQKYFSIILVEFLSCTDKKLLGKKVSFLGALQSICECPNFNQDFIQELATSTQNFNAWLEKKVKVKDLWFPSINKKTNLSIERKAFIKICGNISKHNFTRLSGVVKDLIKIFEENEMILEKEDALLILGEFYEWFHDNILNYHSSAIAEFLNNIRLGIYEYLQYEFSQSIVCSGGDGYTIPKGINNKFARNCYWDLMNDIKSKPPMNKFKVTRYLKKRY